MTQRSLWTHVRAETDYLRLFFCATRDEVRSFLCGGCPEAISWFVILVKNKTKEKIMPRRPDLEYLKAVNQAAPPVDSQVLFLLMGQYANANLQAEGDRETRLQLRPQFKDETAAPCMDSLEAA